MRRTQLAEAERLIEIMLGALREARESAVKPWPRAMTAGAWWMCRTCGKGWEGDREVHASGCMMSSVNAALALAEDKVE